MIADATHDNRSNTAMASTSDSKSGGEELKEEEDSSPAEPIQISTNGEITHKCESVKVEEEEDGRVSSEDEDKLVINETCDKKDAAQHLQIKSLDQSVPAPVACALTPLRNPEESKSQNSQNELIENHLLKSPLKRSVNEVEASDALPYSAKKPRTLDYENENERVASSPPTHVEKSLAQLKRDLQGIELLLHQKEEEWNSLLRLQKKKEELYIRLLRKSQIIKTREKECKEEENMSEGEESVLLLPQGIYSSLGSSQFPLMMLKHMLGDNNLPQVLTSKESFGKNSSSSNGPLTSQNSSVSVIDIHTNSSKTSGPLEAPQISISSEVHSKLGKHLNSMMSVKPILPKPTNSFGSISNPEEAPPPHSYPPTGYGPQGPTVSVHHLIAAHRKDNPNVPPIRGAKRGAWRHRYENEKRNSPREIDRPSSVSSSNSETDIRVNPNPPLSSKGNSSNNSSNNLLTMNDPSVSYKDVLLQFAQLTQTEKQPGSPQISIIPVSSGEVTPRKLEHTPDSTSASRELSSTPQSSSYSHNLEGSSALAKLLLESGAGNHVNVSKSSAVDLSSYNSSPHCLTLSALLSGGTTTTVKDKITTPTIVENRPKKNGSTEDGNTNPKCQGCHKHRAQFVCAGCSNQWYCSRNCQVTAWDKHSEHCSS